MYKYLLKEPLRKIDSVLNRKFPISTQIANRYRRQLIETKQKIRKAKIKDTHHHKLWRELIKHLRYEYANTLVGSRYDRHPSRERDAAYDAYLLVLETLLGKLESYANEGDTNKPNRKAGDIDLETPTQIADRKNLPNHGSHWTDWVPDKIKLRVTPMFHAIPYTAKAKRRLPFLRTIRPEPKREGDDPLSVAQRRLHDRTSKELQIERTKYYGEGVTDVRAKRIAQMGEALLKIADMKRTDFVPLTWHGLFPEYQNKRKTKTVHGEPKDDEQD